MIDPQLIARLRMLAIVAQGWEYTTVIQESEDETCEIGHTNDSGEFHGLLTVDCENYGFESKPLANYIAATSPKVIITLLDALEAAQRTIELQAQLSCGLQAWATEQSTERDKLAAELKAIRKQEPVGSFLVNREGYYSQVAHEFENDSDVIKLYACPIVQPAPFATLQMGPDGKTTNSVVCDPPLGFGAVLLVNVLPAKMLELSADDIRAAGGIVHSDGNIFFTNIDKLNAAINAKGAQ